MEDILEGEAWKRPLVEKAVARVVLEGSLTLVIADPPLQFFSTASHAKKLPYFTQVEELPGHYT
jgi:hypothetical protein